MRRLASVSAAILVCAALVVLGYWAGSTALVPPELPAASHPTQTYAVAEGSVGRVVQVAVTASWPINATLLGGADGVVTAVRHEPGALAHAGEVVATIDLRPIVVAQGSTPMFRALQRDDRGPDVRQLQALLRAGGFLKRAPTGLFDAATLTAAKAWQKSIGAVADGTIEMGSLLFVPSLPARLAILPKVGSRAAPGMEFASVLAAQPSFAVLVDSAQTADVVLGTPVTVSASDGGSWAGTAGALKPTDNGKYSSSLTGALCGGACSAIPLDGETQLTGTVVVVPERRGIVVPVAALTQLPSGAVAVSLADGTRREVTVTAQANGFAVVEGLAAGTSILLPAEPGS